MNHRSTALACAALLLLGACAKRDDMLTAPAAAPAASEAGAAAPAAAPAAGSAAVASAVAAEAPKDNSWAGQVNQAKAASSAQTKAGQEHAAKADEAAK